MRLADAIATPDGKLSYVRKLFSTIADRYDLITVVLSYGQDQRWKRRLVDLAAPRLESGGLALDLATGTGDIAFRLASSGWNVVGLDVTRRMIELARSKAAGKPDRSVPGFLVGDMLALPFPARVFDHAHGTVRPLRKPSPPAADSVTAVPLSAAMRAPASVLCLTA